MRRFTRDEVRFLLSQYLVTFDRKTRVQDIVYEEWKKQNCRGTPEIATGVGKTRIAIMAIIDTFQKNPNANVIIGIPTTGLRDNDWPDEMRLWNAAHLIDKVRLVTHVSLPKIIVQGDIDLLILDECHHLTPKMCEIFEKYQVWSRMGLSALLPTLTEDFAKRTLLDKYFPVIFRVTLDDALTLQLITDFEITLLKFYLDDSNLNVNSASEKEIARGTSVMVSEQTHYEKLTKQLAVVKSKGGAGFYWIQKRTELIMNLPTKKQLAKEAMQFLVKGNARTLIFCGSQAQCDDLGGKDHSYHSGKSNSENDRVLNAFNSEQISYICSVKALNEGKNLRKVDQSFIVQASAKLKDLIQRLGRNVRWREGVDKVNIYILVAANTIDEVWVQNALYTFDKRKIKTIWIKPKQGIYGA